MHLNVKNISFLSGGFSCISNLPQGLWRRLYSDIPFLDLFKKTTGNSIPEDYIQVLKKRHPHIDKLSYDNLQCSLNILQKFNITAKEACSHPHIFTMNPITMDNYGEILRECGFISISAQNIIKYHTIVKSRTIAKLKKDGLLPEDIQLENHILEKLSDFPDLLKNTHNYSDSNHSILNIRMNILERYLRWKLSVTPEEFDKYCKHYLPLRHKPMLDIQEAVNIAENDIKFTKEAIRRNGFIIASDPLHTKLIIENVPSLAGMDICDVIKIEPALLKNNYNALMEIRDILEEYRIPAETQRRCLKVYCMRPETVRQRLEDLRNMKEYQILSTNPRVLFLVVHKKKMLSRLSKIQTVKKQCYSLNHLVSSRKVFDEYINSFGDKVCSRDIAVLVSSSLKNLRTKENRKQLTSTISNQLKRHKYWLHATLYVVDENIQFLRNQFSDETILNNCQILLYPAADIKTYLNIVLDIREGKQHSEQVASVTNYNNLHVKALTDEQILSLVLYEIEKKYHFSGDGIWTRQDSVKVEVQST